MLCKERHVSTRCPRDEVDFATDRNGIRDAGVVQETALEHPHRHRVCRRDVAATAVRDVAKFFRRSRCENAAVIQYMHGLAERRLVHIGRTHEHGEMFLLRQRLEDLPKLATRERIDADRRLVEDQEFRRAHERAGKAEFLRHVAQDVLHGLLICRHIHPTDAQAPFVRIHQAANEPQEGRLARAVRPDKCRELAGADGKMDMVKRRDDRHLLGMKCFRQIDSFNDRFRNILSHCNILPPTHLQSLRDSPLGEGT